MVPKVPLVQQGEGAVRPGERQDAPAPLHPAGPQHPPARRHDAVLLRPPSRGIRAPATVAAAAVLLRFPGMLSAAELLNIIAYKLFENITCGFVNIRDKDNSIHG